MKLSCSCSHATGWLHHVTLCTIFSILIPEVFLSRSILIVWAVITIVVGAFIFGQSTTIAVMELLNRYWTPQPLGFTSAPGYNSVTLEMSSFLVVKFAQPELPPAKSTFCCASIHILQTEHKQGCSFLWHVDLGRMKSQQQIVVGF